MIQEIIKPSGELKVVLTDKYGEIKQKFIVPNLVVSAGRAHIAARMADAGGEVAMSHMAVGTSASAPVATNTTCNTELHRVALQGAEGVVSAGSNSIVYTAIFPPSSSSAGALVEAGIFNAGTNGSMLCHTVFSVVNKGEDDSVTITWTVTIDPS